MSFKFYKHNRSDQEYELSEEDLKKQFLNYLKTLNKETLDYFSVGNSLCRKFLMQRDDTMDVEDYEKVDEFLYDVKSKYIEQVFGEN
jgi:predicted glycosyltransferase involved in capsule biosynthesis